MSVSARPLHALSNKAFPLAKSYFYAAAAGFFLSAVSPALSEGGNPQLGQRLAQEWCSKCHAIGRFGDSPLQLAPPFRQLHLRYNVEDLGESLAEGIVVGHPTMPVFRFDSDQVENLIAYLKSLEPRSEDKDEEPKDQ
jgi:mono/diheme cytochrome c family protein